MAQKPIVEHRKLVKQGGTYYISIPPEWFVAHDIKPQKSSELLVIANRDMRIVNPADEKAVYADVSKMVKKGDYVEKGGVTSK